MTKEKLMSLESYRAAVRQRLHGVTPPKHTHRVEEFKQFLSRELKAVDLVLEEHRLANVKEGGK